MNETLNALKDNMQDLLIDIKNGVLTMIDVKNELEAMINFIRKEKVEKNI